MEVHQIKNTRLNTNVFYYIVLFNARSRAVSTSSDTSYV